MNDNPLSNEKWSSEKDQIYLKDATPYERKCYHNRYFLAWEKCVKPVLMDFLPINKDIDFNVLDAATGTGAGAAYLAEQIKKYTLKFSSVGVDINNHAIEEAKSTYLGHTYDAVQLQFMQGSLISLFIENHWDCIVSMETLEHVSHNDMSDFLNCCAKYLKPGGKAIFSCPRLRPRESTVKRPGHINELSYQDFKYTLGDRFQFLEFYSFDRYGNVVPDYPDCNLQVAVCSKPPETKVF